MKNLFIFLNIILFICVVALLVVVFSHKAPPREKVLDQTAIKPNNIVPDIFVQPKKLITSSALAIIADNDVFSPSRGISDDPKKTAAEMPKKTQFELTGLCSMGPMKGAIIVNTASRQNENKKQFYAVGEQISDTAYKLMDINPEEETAVIGVGSSQFMIKLERDDQGSMRRRDKGESESKAMISLSKPPEPPPKPETPPTTATEKPETQQNGEDQPVTPTPVPAKAKTAEDVKRIRQEILKKMMSKRNQQ